MIGEGKTEPARVADCGENRVPDCKDGEPECGNSGVPECGQEGVPDGEEQEVTDRVPDHGQEGEQSKCEMQDDSGTNNTAEQNENLTDKSERVGSNTFTRLSLRRKSKKLLKLPGARSLSCKSEKQIEDTEEIGKSLEKLKFQVRLS